MPNVVDFILHSDKHLLEFVRNYDVWVYGILFLIVLAETGFIVTPFLRATPSCSRPARYVATGEMNGWLTFALLAFAAFAGNAVNYYIGRFVGRGSSRPPMTPVSGTSCSTATTWPAGMRSSNGPAGRRSSSAASCRSSRRMVVRGGRCR